MIKQILLSALTGVFVTVIFLATPNANAACQGYCSDKRLVNGCELTYAGCVISYDQNDRPLNVSCSYTGACPGGGGGDEI